VTGVGSAVWDLLTGGSALAALGKVSLAVCALVLGLVHRRYLGILGADRRKPAERQAYDALRDTLVHRSNAAARIYADRLTAFLDRVDRFFGDAGMADRTLFPRAFGLRTPVPLWTAPAFDRCLLLALIYPIVTIFAVWVIAGHTGPAEQALFFQPSLSGWNRGLLGVLFIVTLWLFLRARKSVAWVAFGIVVAIACVGIVVFNYIFGCFACVDGITFSYLGDIWSALAGPVFLAMAALPVGAGVLAGTGAVGVAVVVAVTVIVALALFVTINVFGGVAISGTTVDALHHALAVAFAVNSAVALGSVSAVALPIAVGVAWVGRTAIARGWQGPFLSFFSAAMIAACLLAARLLSQVNIWARALVGRPWLLFLGLLPLLNAPFDWVSLGLTRALLRRGLELGGWWPYALSLVDAGLTAVIIVALTLTTVVGVQAFDELASYAQGNGALSLGNLFGGIEAHPEAPEYWWAYALLLSTTIPSLVNLVIGGTSLVRGLPGMPSLLLRYIPERGSVLKWDRHWIATVLTAQIAAGAALGIAAQAFLVWIIIGHVMPFFGLELLDMAQGVADFNLPARVGQLFGVSL
jgi:hypothetical protein